MTARSGLRLSLALVAGRRNPSGRGMTRRRCGDGLEREGMEEMGRRKDVAGGREAGCHWAELSRERPRAYGGVERAVGIRGLKEAAWERGTGTGLRGRAEGGWELGGGESGTGDARLEGRSAGEGG